ncbi:MAG: hypothetical protein ABGX07_01700 [Pirellulaceae bacterium]|nr:hypothetical protein [Planctomycetota bacterium]
MEAAFSTWAIAGQRYGTCPSTIDLLQYRYASTNIPPALDLTTRAASCDAAPENNRHALEGVCELRG